MADREYTKWAGCTEHTLKILLHDASTVNTIEVFSNSFTFL